MPVTYRKGYKYFTLLVPESSYMQIVPAGTGAVTLLDKCEFKENPQIFDTGIKPITLEPLAFRSVLGYKTVTITLSGVWTDRHKELLKMALLNTSATSPFVFGGEPGSAYSWTICQYFADSPVKCNYAIGCVLKTLRISGNPGEAIRYEATFIGSLLYNETNNPFTSLTPVLPTSYNPMMFCKTQIDILNTGMLQTFSLDITNNFIDENLMVMNYNTIQNVILASIDLKFSCDIPFVAETIYPDFLSQNTTKIGLNISDNSSPIKSWVINMFGQLEDKTIADPDMGRFTSSLVFRLGVADASENALEITCY
ncbi:MAG: hypothetical protein RBR14_06515 [Candidatus Cloacimonas acidaminovorans]|nr:hypothetical protein [Candidatus Cloacimonas acidaminovorans]